MLNDDMQSSVTIKKAELLAAMKKNREEHRAIFLKAQEGYRTLVIAELDSMLAEARAGKRIRRKVELIEPEEHTKDYDRVIAMLEMSVAETVTISESQFSQYVLDQWGWSGNFTSSTSRYTG